MPKKVSPLTDVQIKNAKSQEKPFKLADGGGLYLEVLPTGGKSWRMKYRLGGIEKRIVFGLWPDVSLKQARQLREDARSLLADGLDPGEKRKRDKAEAITDAESTFEKVAREWLARMSTSWTEHTGKTNASRLELYVFPYLGARPIKEIAAPELLAVLRRVESRGAEETARRLRTLCGQVFRYAVATGRRERDPAADLRGALAKAKPTHFASVTAPREVAGLLRALDSYTGNPETLAALKLAPLVFVRPGELRQSLWVILQ